MKILVLNGGSSSLKATLRDLRAEDFAGAPSKPLWEAQVDWGRHSGQAEIEVHSRNDGTVASELAIHSPAEVLRPVMETLWTGASRILTGPRDIDAVGHRIVHGGHAFQQTARINAEVRAAIRKFADFAPEHNRLELEAIEEAERILGPEVPQVAVFDTQFHTTIPQPAAVYPVPFDWYEHDIRRYGFHGISHQYVSRRAAEVLARPPKGLRLVTCHLGNGASLAAVRDGASIDTTMGFTPLEGLMMGTRSGSIDPGIVIYLVRHRGYGADQLDRVLNKESGLKGVSGISSDMREIVTAMETGNQRARLAFDVYTHRLCRELGGMVASLGGLDALVFTAGIGENCAPLRAAVCGQMAFLGVRLDQARNQSPAPDSDVAAEDSLVRVLVIHTDEDWEIARECVRVVGALAELTPPDRR
jgi:acetate kinase